MTTTAPVLGQSDGALGRAAALVADARADFERSARLLDAQIAALHGRWGGAGGSAFFVLHQAWHDRQHTVVAALERFRASLIETERDNTVVDHRAADTLRALGAGLEESHR
jgi:uncharacterized protein YukE